MMFCPASDRAPSACGKPLAFAGPIGSGEGEMLGVMGRDPARDFFF